MGSLHCLRVGCGDSSVVRTDTGTFLVDCHQIGEYLDMLPPDKHIRGVFITHQHEDHYSGLAFLWEKKYTIDCMVYSPYVRRHGDTSVTIEEWNEFNGLKDKFQSNGTKLYSPYRQTSFEKPYWETNGVKFYIIGPPESVASSETREIHDACLVIKAVLGARRCLFCGDASDTLLEYIEKRTKYLCDDILHASHHGSLNGAHLGFVKKCNAQYTLISTESGVYDNVPHPTALARYNAHTAHDVRRTDVDGTWKWGF